MSFSYLSVDCNECGKTINGTDSLRAGMCSKCNQDYDRKVAEVQAEHKRKNEEKLQLETKGSTCH